MGCGDSKLAVATSNAILRRKKSNAGDSVNKRKDVEAKTATDSDKSIPNSTQEQKQQNEQEAGGQVVNMDNVAVVVADEVKDVQENKKGNGDDKEIIAKDEKNKALVVSEHEATGRFITSENSPKLFYSSRKLDEEGNIDAIISEGRSGTSDYHTPRHGPGSKGNSFDDQESKAVEEDNKELLPAAEETKPAEEKKTSSTETKEEPAVVVEEKLVKETAEVLEVKAATLEAKASVAQEEKKEEKKEEKS